MKPIRSIAFFYACLCLLHSEATLAWSSIGHRTIWNIAKQQLSADAKKNIDELLSSLSAEQQEDIAVFPDQVRLTKDWQHTRSYHFINLAPNTDYLAGLKQEFVTIKKKRRKITGAADAILAILASEDVLRSKTSTKEEKIDALRFFVHCAGDIHQPLHAGYADDLGGNEIKGTFILDGKAARWHSQEISLHKVWDDIILVWSYKSYFNNKLDPKPVPAADTYARILGLPSNEQFAAWTANLSPEEWALEGRNYLPNIYTGYRNLDTYIPRHKPVVDARIHEAGVRIAFVINQMYVADSKLNDSELMLRAQVNAVLKEAGTTLTEIIKLNPATGRKEKETAKPAEVKAPKTPKIPTAPKAPKAPNFKSKKVASLTIER